MAKRNTTLYVAEETQFISLAEGITSWQLGTYAVLDPIRYGKVIGTVLVVPGRDAPPRVDGALKKNLKN